MSSKVQLAGGNFQDAEGNELANGYLLMALSQDGQVNQNTQVAGGRRIFIQLDGAGNVITNPAQSVWGNDAISPTGTYYTVTAYTEQGQAVWQQIVQVTGSGEFDTGTWVPYPTNVVPDDPPDITVQQILLETNGVPNASQNTLNLIAGSNITLFPEVGGGVLISASGGGGGGGGINIVTFSTTPNFNLSLGTTQFIRLTGNVSSATTSNPTNGQVYTFVIEQDGTGGHSFTWPSNFQMTGPIDAFDGTANASTNAVQQFVYINSTNKFYAVSALIANQ